MKKFLQLLVIIFAITGINQLSAQPSAPTGLTVNQETKGNYIFVKLSWDSPDSKKIQYYIYKKEGAILDTAGFEKYPVPVHQSLFLDFMVIPGKTYSYYITAADHHQGESSPSDTVQIVLGSSVPESVISGILTDEKTGEGIANGTMTFIPVQGWHVSNAVSDSLGNYSAALYPGEYYIYSKAPEYYHEFYDNVRSMFDASWITVKENEPLTLDISLKPITPPVFYTISGKVTDSTGQPLKAKVQAVVLNPHQSFFQHHRKDKTRNAVTDSSGNYSLKLSEEDSVIIFVMPFSKNYLPEFYNDKQEFAEADPLVITADITGLDFILGQKAVNNNNISGIVKDAEGTGVLSSVTAFKLHERGRGRYKSTVLTDTLGNYKIENLVPGEYILLAIPFEKYIPSFFMYDGSQSLRWKDADSIIVTESSKLTGIDVIVSPIPDSGFADISGTVTDDNGEGINGAIVFVQDVNQNIAASAITDANGRYNLSGLVTGDYTISTDKVDYTSGQLTPVSVDYLSNQPQNIQLTLTPMETTEVTGSIGAPGAFELKQNYPNPFNPVTVIGYQLSVISHTTLKVYDVLGREVAVLVNEVKPAGTYSVKFDAGNLSTGVYIYKLTAGSYTATKKLLLVK